MTEYSFIDIISYRNNLPLLTIGAFMKVSLKNKEIKKILIRNNKSQNWLAHRLEVSTGYMSQLMDGSRNPSPKLRERIMDNLSQYTFDDLFEIKETN